MASKKIHSQTHRLKELFLVNVRYDEDARQQWRFRTRDNVNFRKYHNSAIVTLTCAKHTSVIFEKREVSAVSVSLPQLHTPFRGHTCNVKLSNGTER